MKKLALILSLCLILAYPSIAQDSADLAKQIGRLTQELESLKSSHPEMASRKPMAQFASPARARTTDLVIISHLLTLLLDQQPKGSYLLAEGVSNRTALRLVFLR